jgi:hypothetical protein
MLQWQRHAGTWRCDGAAAAVFLSVAILPLVTASHVGGESRLRASGGLVPGVRERGRASSPRPVLQEQGTGNAPGASLRVYAHGRA